MIGCRFTSSDNRRVSVNACNRERGVGLIEVLVALLVLSLGFLVSANMQLRGMRANQDTFHHAQALMLVNDMMDRMRNNRQGVIDGAYDGMQTDAVDKPGCASNGCDAQGLAELDRFEWSATLQSLRGETSFIPMLPADNNNQPAVGSISGPDADGIYTLSMDWKRQDGGNEVDETLSVKFVP
ncbi:MAG: type IV pilus modification protein PilV [Granulosicoccus sp.]